MDLNEHFTLLTRFALGVALAVLLPKAMERLRLPGVLGFILAGILVGPSVFNILHQDGPAIVFLAEVGKLLFMFFVGFEIDLEEFKKSRGKSLTFGALTFLLPFAFGTALGKIGGASWNSSLLIGSLIASHTLLAFPILQKFGLLQHPSATMVVGGTIFTDIASMLVLAVTVSVHQSGFSWAFMGQEFLQLAIFVPLVIFGAGTLARKAIIRFGKRSETRMMILMVVIALCAEGASFIHLEGIVGAFLAGIAIKRALRGKFAVEQLEVTAHAIFIPAFFLTTGFLVNFSVLGQTIASRPMLVIGLILALVAGKWIAAWLCARLFKPMRDCTGLIFSLSLPQMAATLASAVVAYQAVNSSGERLLDQSYVNGVLVLVVATCVLGPILSERYARKITGPTEKEGTTAPAGAPW